MEGPPSSPDPKPIEHLLPKTKRLLSQSKGLMTELEVKRLEWALFDVRSNACERMDSESNLTWLE